MTNETAKTNEFTQRNTIQKQIVEGIVLSSCDHPTAETIYNRARMQLPKISLGTVYRILSGLVEDGSVREVSVPSAPSRFDKTTKIHAHFVCRQCGDVTDIAIEEGAIIDEAKRKNCNSIDEAEIIFRGICCGCNASNQV
ncbi:MAG: transcriptional repressor [Clostridia bacterium]